jgi:hypothetical protein
MQQNMTETKTDRRVTDYGKSEVYI